MNDARADSTVPKECADRTESALPARQKWAIALWAAQLTAVFFMLLLASLDVETVVFNWPIVSAIGFALALITRQLRSWIVLLFALSAPLVCAVGAMMIAVFRLNPDSAEGPIRRLLWVYTVLALLSAVAVLYRILDWRNAPAPRRPRAWRYSLKTLLAAMTGVCIGATIVSAADDDIESFQLVFASFAAIAISLAGLLAWRFFTEPHEDQ